MMADLEVIDWVGGSIVADISGRRGLSILQSPPIRFFWGLGPFKIFLIFHIITPKFENKID